MTLAHSMLPLFPLVLSLLAGASSAQAVVAEGEPLARLAQASHTEDANDALLRSFELIGPRDIVAAVYAEGKKALAAGQPLPKIGVGPWRAGVHTRGLSVKGPLSFSNVFFSYQDARDVFDELRRKAQALQRPGSRPEHLQDTWFETDTFTYDLGVDQLQVRLTRETNTLHFIDLEWAGKRLEPAKGRRDEVVSAATLRKVFYAPNHISLAIARCAASGPQYKITTLKRNTPAHEGLLLSVGLHGQSLHTYQEREIASRAGARPPGVHQEQQRIVLQVIPELALTCSTAAQTAREDSMPLFNLTGHGEQVKALVEAYDGKTDSSAAAEGLLFKKDLTRQQSRKQWDTALASIPVALLRSVRIVTSADILHKEYVYEAGEWQLTATWQEKGDDPHLSVSWVRRSALDDIKDLADELPAEAPVAPASGAVPQPPVSRAAAPEVPVEGPVDL